MSKKGSKNMEAAWNRRIKVEITTNAQHEK